MGRSFGCKPQAEFMNTNCLKAVAPLLALGLDVKSAKNFVLSNGPNSTLAKNLGMTYSYSSEAFTLGFGAREKLIP